MNRPVWWGLVLVLLGCAGLSAQTLTKSTEGVFVTDGTEGKIAMSKGRRLIIGAAGTLGGDITLKTGAKECRYVYKKLLKTPSKVEAADYAALISVVVDLQKEDVVMSLQTPDKVPWAGTNNSGRLAIEITLPESCAVQINAVYFNVEAVGPFREFIVSESLSKVDVQKVRGDVDVRVSNRPLSIKDVRGTLFATNKYGRIRLENIDTGEGLGTIRNEHGEVSIDAYRGGLDLRTSYDNIVGQHLFLSGSKNRVKNVSGLVTLEFDSLTTGKLRMSNTYSPISLNIANAVSAKFICKIGDGSRVTAENMEMTPDLVYESRLEFIAGGGEAEVRLTTDGSGDITIIGPNKGAVAGGK